MKPVAIAAVLAGLIGLGIFLVPMGSPSVPVDGESPAGKTNDIATHQAQQARGAYLAQAGNCMGCHTAQGGKPYAGGHFLATSIGTFITPNITPDEGTGIGRWSEQDFWLALHDGKARDGRPLYPAFPYTDYTKVTREDANAIFAYLQSLPRVEQSNPPNRISFPFNLRPLLYVWRVLYFTQRAMSGTVAPIWRKDSGIAMLATQAETRWVQARAIYWEADRSWALTGMRLP